MAAVVLRRIPLKRVAGQQRGVALISVLLVTALAVSLAAAMAARSWFDLRRGSHFVDARQAWHYALAGETLARQLLAGSLREQPGVDHLGQGWARPGLRFELEEGELALRIHDLQGRFNLNNLVDASGTVRAAELARLRLLFEALGIDPAPVAALRDWLLQEQARRQQRPAGAGDWPFADTSVLVAYTGMAYADYRQLAPHLSALPGHTAVNVNTATEPVLRTLSPIMSGQRVASVLRRQAAGGYASLQAFTQDTGMGGGGTLLAVSSDFFEVRTEVRFAGGRSDLVSVLQRRRGDAPGFDVLGRQQAPMSGEPRA